MTALLAYPGFKFGCDPELFVVDSNEVPVSAAGLLPGTKEEPFKVEKGAVQVDGMAAEFNIDPATSFEEFNDNIVTVMKELKNMLPKGLKLVALPSVDFSREVFENAPPEARELGCSADFNAWTGECNTPPFDPENPFMRTASGHLHIGWTEPDENNLTNLQHIMNCRDLVQQLDWYLGGWSTLKDKDTRRRRLYGKAGACRYKPYGVEYRVLSNFWVTDKQRRLAVWNRMNQAIMDMQNLYVPEKAKNYNDLLIKRINEGVVDPSLEMLRFPVYSTSYSQAIF